MLRRLLLSTTTTNAASSHTHRFGAAAMTTGTTAHGHEPVVLPIVKGVDPNTLPRVSPEDVADSVRNAAGGAGSSAAVAVVDVRDADEFASGHVKGALNLPAAAFVSDAAADAAAVDKLVAALPANAEKVVVHCAYSVKRGPTSAAALAARLKELGKEVDVAVLQGGFSAVEAAFGKDEAVVARPSAAE